MLNKLNRNSWFIVNAKTIFQMEMIYKMVAVALGFPLIVLLLTLTLKIAGINYLTNEYIMKAILNPIVIIVVVLAIFAVSFYCIYEMSFINMTYEFTKRNYKPSIFEIFSAAFKRLKRALKISNIGWIIWQSVSMLIMNAAVIYYCFCSNTLINLINMYIIKGRLWTKFAVAAVIVLIMALASFNMYTFIIWNVKRCSFSKAAKKSFKIVKNNIAKSILPVLAYNIVILIIVSLLYVVISIILVAGVKILSMTYMASAVYLSIIKYIKMGINFLLICIAIPALQIVVINSYYSCVGFRKIKFEEKRVSKNYDAYRKIYNVILVVCIIVNIANIVFSFNKNPFDNVAIFHETNITAHRGSSKYAPENTLSAFKKAIEDMADYIELDARETKDGHIVIMHDNSVYRTTGATGNISDMTLSEVKKLDAGYLFQDEYKDEKVPTLEEVLELIKGKSIKLNIEIKTYNNSSEIADKVVSILEKYDMAGRCVITSFDYNTLKEVKRVNPKIQVGYILSIAYGNYYDMPDIDFLSMNASFLSKSEVDAIHNSGKQVFAWTINSETSIRNLTNKGVDNIITDVPVRAREVIYSRDTSETLINMLKYVFDL